MAVPIVVSIQFINLTEPFRPSLSYPFTCRNKTLTLTHFKCLCLTSPQPSPPSDSTPFSVSYLINNFDFSPQTASKLCSTYRLDFKTTQKPDSAINFFTNYGFSDSQLRNMIAKAPWLLTSNLSKKVLPKFEFFLSKGLSKSDLIKLISKKPRILRHSLDNHIAPTYDLIYRFLQSHEETIDRAFNNVHLFHSPVVTENIRLLIDNGVADANIALILRISNYQTVMGHNMLNVVDELKDLGFNPSKTTFGVALKAKLFVTKTWWKAKVDAYKNWGWSDEDVIQAFKKDPHCMIASIDKINLMMDFWVNQLGWDALAITKYPTIFNYSLEKRIIPRARVVQFLLNNGLRKKDASLTAPFQETEKTFLDKFIKPFEKESAYLLNLYKEKLNLACHD